MRQKITFCRLRATTRWVKVTRLPPHVRGNKSWKRRLRLEISSVLLSVRLYASRLRLNGYKRGGGKDCRLLACSQKGPGSSSATGMFNPPKPGLSLAKRTGMSRARGICRPNRTLRTVCHTLHVTDMHRAARKRARQARISGRARLMARAEVMLLDLRQTGRAPDDLFARDCNPPPLQKFYERTDSINNRLGQGHHDARPGWPVTPEWA